MTVKLRIDLSQGILEVEGEESFVREIHKEFQNYAGKVAHGTRRSSQPGDNGDEELGEADEGDVQRVAKKRRVIRKPKAAPADGQAATKGKVGNYQPTVLKDLKLDGLKEFYQTFDTTSHQEKILIFGVYLRDKQDLPVFTADHLFTCYRALTEKPPKAFLQAIRDVSAKKHWINYVAPEHITVVHIGDTYFTHDLKRIGDKK